MEQYRFNPYTGEPLRPANNRTWLGSGYQTGGVAQDQQGNTRPNQPDVLVRPVASYDEAKAVPTDFSGVLTIMPDWTHGYIYAKALGGDGTPVFRAYRYEPPAGATAAPPAQSVAYAPLEELQQLRQDVNALREELAAAKAPAKETAEKPAGKGK